MICRSLFAGLFFAGLCSGAYTSIATVSFAAATGSTQTNITLAFTGSDAKLKTVANGGQIQNTVTRVGVVVPADLILTDDATCATITGGYTWGIEHYVATTGAIIGWAKTTLTTGGPVVPRVCIGNVAVTTYQGGAQGAEFDANTLAVYHLPNGSTLSALDFSANANNGNITGTSAVAGKIDGAGSFNGTTNYILSSSVVNTPTVTVSTWINLRLLPVGRAPVIGFTQGNGSGTYDKVIFLSTLGQASFYVYDGGVKETSVTSALSLNTWYYLTGTADGTNIKIYLNGSLAATLAAGNTFAGYGAPNLLLGGSAGGSLYVQQYLDKSTYVSVARSADWIATEYANQNNPPAISAFTLLATPKSQMLSF